MATITTSKAGNVTLTIRDKNGKFGSYRLTTIFREHGMAWRLYRAAERSWIVSVDFGWQEWHCNCPAKQFNPGDCKHLKALRSLLGALGFFEKGDDE